MKQKTPFSIGGRRDDVIMETSANFLLSSRSRLTPLRASGDGASARQPWEGERSPGSTNIWTEAEGQEDRTRTLMGTGISDPDRIQSVASQSRLLGFVAFEDSWRLRDPDSPKHSLRTRICPLKCVWEQRENTDQCRRRPLALSLNTHARVYVC